MSNRVLVVGYGNTTRQDDGAGVHLAERLRARELPDVDIWTYHQLNLELLEELEPYHSVLFLDAGQQEEEVVLRAIEVASKGARMVSSHHLNPELFVRMARTVYDRELRLFVCSIRAETFELKDEMRPAMKSRLDQAETMVLKLIRKEQQHA